MIDEEFVPEYLEIEPGTQVVFRNTDSVVHTVTGFGIDEQLQPGELLRHGFDEPGEYVYECTIHPGMSGTIRVLEAEVEQ